jgi:GTP cyclohydrolase IB
MTPKTMPDLQQSRDHRKIPIRKVGVKNISYPIVVQDKHRTLQHTVARVDMYVDLPHQFQGHPHEPLCGDPEPHREQIALDRLEDILQEMRQKLGAETAHLRVEFPYFIDKAAPVSKARSLMEYTCEFDACLSGDQLDFVLGVKVPVTSLCPCSKELSQFGAHNQRSIMTVKVRYRDFIWIEDLVELIEQCGSSPLYALLKRADEKHVTEQAYLESPLCGGYGAGGLSAAGGPGEHHLVFGGGGEL